eukprot:3733009-Prymnesium_polylepis.1
MPADSAPPPVLFPRISAHDKLAPPKPRRLLAGIEGRLQALHILRVQAADLLLRGRCHRLVDTDGGSMYYRELDWERDRQAALARCERERIGGTEAVDRHDVGPRLEGELAKPLAAEKADDLRPGVAEVGGRVKYSGKPMPSTASCWSACRSAALSDAYDAGMHPVHEQSWRMNGTRSNAFATLPPTGLLRI